MKLTQHRIDTGNHNLIKQQPRLPFAQQIQVDQLLKEMQQNDCIEPLTSLAYRLGTEDSYTRFCADYHRLKDIIKKNSYPLTRINDTLDTLPGHKWFSTLDLKIHPDELEETVFTKEQKN